MLLVDSFSTSGLKRKISAAWSAVSFLHVEPAGLISRFMSACHAGTGALAFSRSWEFLFLLKPFGEVAKTLLLKRGSEAGLTGPEPCGPEPPLAVALEKPSMTAGSLGFGIRSGPPAVPSTERPGRPACEARAAPTQPVMKPELPLGPVPQ